MIDIVRSTTDKFHIVAPAMSDLWSSWRFTKCGRSIHNYSRQATQEEFDGKIAAGGVCRKCLKKANGATA